MHRLALLTLGALLILFLCARGHAQNPATSPQITNATPVVDGAVHPELIPDLLAYRLYFVTMSVGQNPTSEDLKVQDSHLQKIGLRDEDRARLVAVLAEFAAKHDVLVSQYNQATEAAMKRNEAPNIANLLKQLDALVQSTRDTLKNSLTPAGMTQFDAFVRSEKKNMKAQVPAGG